MKMRSVSTAALGALSALLILGASSTARPEETQPEKAEFGELLKLAKQWEEGQGDVNLRFLSEDPGYSLIQHHRKGATTLYVDDNVGPQYLPSLKGSYYGYWENGQASYVLEKTGLKVQDSKSSNGQLRYLHGLPSDKIQMLKDASRNAAVMKTAKTYIVAFEIDPDKQVASGLFNILPLPSWPYNSYQFPSTITYFFSDQGKLERILARTGPFISSVVVSTSKNNALAEFEARLAEVKSAPASPLKTLHEAMLQQVLALGATNSRLKDTQSEQK